MAPDLYSTFPAVTIAYLMMVCSDVPSAFYWTSSHTKQNMNIAQKNKVYKIRSCPHPSKHLLSDTPVSQMPIFHLYLSKTLSLGAPLTPFVFSGGGLAALPLLPALSGVGRRGAGGGQLFPRRSATLHRPLPLRVRDLPVDRRGAGLFYTVQTLHFPPTR